MDEEVTAAVVDFLNRQGVHQRALGKTEPFSLTVGYMLPHPPYVPRRADFEHYWGRAPLPRKPQAFKDVQHPYLRRWREHTGTQEVTAPEALNVRTAYWALVSVVDRMVGRVLAALQANGLAQNTLVIYTSDHGDMLGEHGLWWKHLFYEESVRVPLTVAWPGVVPGGQRIGRVVSALDVTATLLDAAGAPPLPGSPGRSLLGLIVERDTPGASAAADWEDVAFSEYCEDQYSPPGGCYARMIRRDEWKLVYYDGYSPQLFNLRMDPDERIDRAGDPAVQDIRRTLAEEVLTGWDPAAIRLELEAKQADFRILAAWANKVQPADRFRWRVRPEMNFREEF